MDLQHHIFSLTLDGQLHLAPLDAGVRDVLDMGTGTGIWAIDFAKLHPEANVIGSDSSGFERPESFVRDDLTNLSFGKLMGQESPKSLYCYSISSFLTKSGGDY